MRSAVITALLLVLALNTGWFVVYSAQLGWQGVAAATPQEISRVFRTDTPIAATALALHMLSGGLVTVGAPLQALPVVRTRWPRAHRRAGYALLALAAVTGLGGLVYIALHGTVGGPWMSLWFALYGAALIWSAAATVYFALDKDRTRHFAWAVRFVILSVGSWIYRMHYALWFGLTGGLYTQDDFTGLFDRIQVFAFFVPYLLGAQLLLRRGLRRPARA